MYVLFNAKGYTGLVVTVGLLDFFSLVLHELKAGEIEISLEICSLFLLLKEKNPSSKT